MSDDNKLAAADYHQIHCCISYGPKGGAQYIIIQKLPDGSQTVELVRHPGMGSTDNTIQGTGMLVHIVMGPLTFSRFEPPSKHELTCPPELIFEALCDFTEGKLVSPPEYKELVEEVLGRCVQSCRSPRRGANLAGKRKRYHFLQSKVLDCKK
ncbi:MAG: hypothetical protein EBU46_18610 [Nitrosomonadaceae bacterium]|nr:hypothetical protein [Nitrosomonadaceae bacterium]